MTRTTIEKRLARAEQQVEFYQKRLGLDLLLRKWQRKAQALSKKISVEQQQQIAAARAEIDAAKSRPKRAINVNNQP